VLAERVAARSPPARRCDRTLTAIIGILPQPLERSAGAVIAGGLALAALAAFAGVFGRD